MRTCSSAPRESIDRPWRLAYAPGMASPSLSMVLSRHRQSTMRLGRMIILAFVVLAPSLVHAAKLTEPVIAVEPDAGQMALLGANDLRVYWARMTGRLLPVVPVSADTRLSDLPDGSFVLGRTTAHPVLRALPPATLAVTAAELGDEGFKLKTVVGETGRVTLIAANDERGVMYGAYGFLERAGVWFFVEHDVVPERVDPATVTLDVVEKPWLATRGALPWSNFPASPLAWDRADYLRYVDQMVKQRFNLLLFHVYREEPYLRFTYRGHAHEVLHGDVFGPLWKSKRTPLASELPHGIGALFADPVFGTRAATDATDDESSFRRSSAMLRDAFDYAKQRGMRVVMGFEINDLTDDVKPLVPESARFQGTDLLDPFSDGAREILELRIRSVVETYPQVDAVMFWQPETIFMVDPPLGRSAAFDAFYARHRAAFMQDPPPATDAAASTQFDLRVRRAVWTAAFFQAAVEVMARVAPGKKAIIGGWGGAMNPRGQLLGSIEGLDRLLPKSVVFTYLTGFFGHANVSPLFGSVVDREKWPMSWFESDNALWFPQPNVARTDAQLVTARKYGATGWAGIHWRTRSIEKAVSFAARKLWSAQLTPAAFYQQFVRAEFGGGADMAAALTRLDAASRYVDSAEWTGYGPGLSTGALPDEQRTALLEAIAVVGRHHADGERAERLADLQSELALTRALDATGSAVQEVLAALAAAKDDNPVPPEKRQRIAAAAAALRATPLDAAFVAGASRARVKEHVGALLGLAVMGEPSLRELVALADARSGTAAPPSASPSGGSPTFTPHSFLWSRSTRYDTGAAVPVEAIIATTEPVTATLKYRTLGGEPYASVPMQQRRGSAYTADIPAEALTGEVVEYFVDVASARTGQPIPALRYPTTAPALPAWIAPRKAAATATK
jgi:hypothetical protein